MKAYSTRAHDIQAPNFKSKYYDIQVGNKENKLGNTFLAFLSTKPHEELWKVVLDPLKVNNPKHISC
jgi:hypothetical protein